MPPSRSDARRRQAEADARIEDVGDQAFELGRRTRGLPPPSHVVWESLTQPRRPGARPWLQLLEDETEPRILARREPDLVVWSSLWPKTPDLVIRLVLTPQGGSTKLTWILTSPVELDASAVGHRRFRLNHLFFADLRYSYGQ